MNYDDTVSLVKIPAFLVIVVVTLVKWMYNKCCYSVDILGTGQSSNKVFHQSQLQQMTPSLFNKSFLHVLLLFLFVPNCHRLLHPALSVLPPPVSSV